jgi:hypothetical protein
VRWTRHLFQGRFASVVLDEDHLIAAARYVALNPVRAWLAARARDDDAARYFDANLLMILRVASMTLRISGVGSPSVTRSRRCSIG